MIATGMAVIAAVTTEDTAAIADEDTAAITAAVSVS